MTETITVMWAKPADLHEHSPDCRAAGCVDMVSAAAHRHVVERVRALAVLETRYPLALFATCSLCGTRTDSLNLHRMEPEPRHTPGCPLSTP